MLKVKRLGFFSSHVFILISAILSLLIMGVMNFWLIPSIVSQAPDMKVFDLCFTGYNPEYAKSFIDAIGPVGKQIYLTRQLPLDFLFSFVYSSFYFALSLELGGKVGSFLKIMIFLLFISDFFENILVYSLIKNNNFSHALVSKASFFTQTKSVFLFMVLGVFFLCFAYKTINAFLRKLSSVKGA